MQDKEKESFVRFEGNPILTSIKDHSWENYAVFNPTVLLIDKKTYIIYKPHRYICEDCDDHPSTTATPSWHKRDSNYTIDYENHVLMELIAIKYDRY